MAQHNKNSKEEGVVWDSKYDVGMEKAVLDWIAGVLEQPDLFAGTSGPDDLHAKLKSGVLLCQLMNKIQAGAIKKFNNKAKLMCFAEMENIGFFNAAMRDYGVNPDYIFVTVDLYEKKNMTQVLIGLRALGTKANEKGVTPAIAM